jgi:hypothetical protein
MTHTFEHTIEELIFPDGLVEIDLEIEYEHHPASPGTFPDDSTESRIEILSCTKPNGKEWQGDTNEFTSLCWDHFLKLKQ